FFPVISSLFLRFISLCGSISISILFKCPVLRFKGHGMCRRTITHNFLQRFRNE
ncbi:hypothetical protein L9F63_003704, partial [Diploptera punctata]